MGPGAVRHRPDLRAACRSLGTDAMNVETPRLASLRAKLKARKGKKEYEKNCEEIEREIARLENCQELDL
jgi:hypothetical protein